MRSKYLKLLAIILIYVFSLVEVAAKACDEEPNKKVGFSQAILNCKQIISELEVGSSEYVSGTVQLSVLYRKSGDLGSAQEILTQLLSVLPDSLKRESIFIQRQLGATLFYQQNYEKAFEAFSQALQTAKEISDDNLVAISYSDIAGIYQLFGDFETSSKLLLKSYDIHNVNNNSVARAIVLTNLGNIYRDKKAYDEAIVAYRQAFELHSQAGEDFKAAHTLSSLARTFNLAGNADQASKLLEQAADIFNSLDAYKFKGDTYLLLAELYVSELNTDKAQEWLDIAKQTFNLVQSEQPISKVWFIQGLIWQKSGLNQKASEAFEKSLAAIDESESKIFVGNLYNVIAEMKEQSSEFESASTYWKLYSETLTTQLLHKDKLNANRLKSHFLFAASTTQKTPALANQWVYLCSIIFLFFACIWLFFKARTKKHVFTHAESVNTEEYEPVSLVDDDGLERTTEDGEQIQEEELRLKLVELMLLAIQVWENETNTSKLELAQKSKLWSVAIDDGRLRARALERYVSVNALPKNPRWRTVLRTCHFVVKNATISTLDTQELETKMRSFQRVMKTKALKK